MPRRMVGVGHGGFNSTFPEVAAVALAANEPAGMTQLGYNDGSVLVDASNQAFGIDGFTNFAAGAASNRSVVNDGPNPSGSGKALSLRWDPDNPDGVDPGQATLTFPGAATYRHMYIARRIILVSGGGWDGQDGAPKFYYPRPADANSGFLSCAGRNSDSTAKGSYFETGTINGGSTIWNTDLGGVHPYPIDADIVEELHLVSESTDGAADGEAHLWINGSLIESHTALAWQVAGDFTGIQWYLDADWPFKTEMRVRELYFSGKN